MTDEPTPTDDPAPTDEPSPTADAPSRERVREALSTVADPDLGTDVVSSGLVEDIAVDDGIVTVQASFAGFDDATADEVVAEVRTSILELPGVQNARVQARAASSGDNDARPPDAPDGSDAPDVPGEGGHSHGGNGGHHGHDAQGGHQHASQTGGPGPDPVSLPGVERVLAVASAKGGVGKTTVATQLARALDASGETVGLFDADVYGPNVPRLLDVDEVLEATEDGRARPVDVDGLDVLSVGLIANDEPLAWRGSMAQEAVLELLGDAAWRDLDTLVLDLPPGTGDIPLTVLQAVPVDATVLVTTPFETATSDTARSATLFREQGVPVLGAVHNMASFVCPSCGDAHSPFYDHDSDDENAGTTRGLDVDVLAELPLDERLRDATGDVPDEFRDLADAVATALDDAGGFDLPAHALDLRGVPDRARHDQLRAEYDALDPGEPLYAKMDTDPRPLATAIASQNEPAPPIIDVDRRGPSTYALRLERPPADATDAPDGEDAHGVSDACACNGDHATHRH